MKRCRKDLHDFDDKRCQECRAQRMRDWHQNNKERELTRMRKWQEENKTTYVAYRKAYCKKYRQDNLEKMRSSNNNYYYDNKEILLKKQYAYKKQKLKINPIFKLSEALRRRLLCALKGAAKGGSAVKELGCSVQEAKQYIEAKFQPGMTWDNWGVHGWHLDHIKPLKSFDLTNPEHIKQVCHYTNLQPLWASDNLKKGAK